MGWRCAAMVPPLVFFNTFPRVGPCPSRAGYVSLVDTLLEPRSYACGRAAAAAATASRRAHLSSPPPRPLLPCE
eukprot:4856831-Prymnesium_polylepis.1